MQFSPEAAIPIVSTVDGGTVDLVRCFKIKVVSSAELLQKFAARWTPDQFQSHVAAGKVIDRIIQQAFGQAAIYVRQGKALTEHDLQQWILEQFRANLIVTDDAPIVAIGPHSGDPHYEPRQGASAPIKAGELLLLDVWGRTRGTNSVYYDVTWVGFLGDKVPEKHAAVFDIVKDARDAAVNLVLDSVKAGKRLEGWQVDKAARSVIEKAGYGKYFTHRTGHNIGTEVHGIGANMDGLETRDTRAIIPHTCFSVEPGIYLPEFGIRSEVNVYVADRQARVTGAVQTEVLPLLA
jgi:Xaa-Pro aminopeptidase